MEQGIVTYNPWQTNEVCVYDRFLLQQRALNLHVKSEFYIKTETWNNYMNKKVK